jgi:hemerythrin-like domain-containing protein
MLARLQRLALSVVETPSLSGALRSDVERFMNRFRRHLALEDRILVPTLREIDAWGEERARRVEQEHSEQRGTIQAILDGLRNPNVDAADLARDVLRLITDLYTDMAQEEEAVLHEDLLRDDIVAIDAQTG